MDIKQLSESKNVPIVRPETLNFMIKTINEKKYKSLLEIGTAIGYSSFMFASNTNLEYIHTIEKNIDLYNQAILNLKSILKISVFNADAYDYIPNLKYDVIFIDGPKAKLQVLVEKYIHYLNRDGVIFVDNIFLNKVRDSLKIKKSKSKEKLVKAVDRFLDYLNSVSDKYNITFFEKEDGLAIVKLK